MDPRLEIEPRTWALLDMAGAEVHFQVRSMDGPRLRYDSGSFAEAVFVAEDVPGLGSRAYRFERRGTPLPPHRRTDTLFGDPAREKGSAPTTGLAIGPGRMANEHLEVEVEADGALTVRDLETGLTYGGLNRFLDGGDAGDTYNYSWPPGDQLFSTDGVKPSLEWIELGPARATLRIVWQWSLPEGLTPDRQSRSSKHVPLTLAADVSLAAHARRIDVAVHFVNTARDHRLQAVLPLGAPIDRFSAESTFAVVERPVELPPGQRGSAEPAVHEHPQQAFASVSAAGRGFTIANRGLHEVSARPSGELVLTLLRSIGYLSRDDLVTRVGGAGPCIPTPEAQMLGPVRAEYSIIPHAGDWERSRAHLAAHAFAAPLAAVTLKPQGTPRPLPVPERRPELRAGESLLEVEGDVVITALKRAEDRDALVVRVLNEGSQVRDVRFRPQRRARHAEVVDLREQRLAALQIDAAGWIAASIEPWRLLTVAIEF
jgi:hypothetical protein